MSGSGLKKAFCSTRLPALERDFNRPELTHVAADHDALGGQVLLGDGTGGHAHGGFARRAAATPTVITDAVLVVVGVIGVGRAEGILDRRVVLGLLVGIADQQANRTAGGLALEDAGEDFHLIVFLTLRGVAAGAWLAPIEVALQVLQANLQPRRAAIDNGDQRRAMAFASGGDSEQLAVGIAGHVQNAPRKSAQGRASRHRALLGVKAASIPVAFVQIILEPSAAVKRPTGSPQAVAYP